VSVLMCEPLTVAIPEPEATTGVSGVPFAKNPNVRLPVNGTVPACASTAPHARAITARIENDLRMGSLSSGTARFPAAHPTPPRERERRESSPEQQHRPRLGHEVERHHAEDRDHGSGPEVGRDEYWGDELENARRGGRARCRRGRPMSEAHLREGPDGCSADRP